MTRATIEHDHCELIVPMGEPAKRDANVAPPPSPVCRACSAAIGEQTVVECQKQLYHKQCFSCSDCEENLVPNATDKDEKSTLLRRGVYLVDGKLVCSPCYLGSCSKCNYVLTEKTYLQVDDILKYHTMCFCCESCNEQLTGQFFQQDDKLFCPIHYLKQFFYCAVCRRIFKFGQKFLAFSNHKYHVECFVCNLCRKPLEQGHQSDAQMREFYLVDEKPCCMACFPIALSRKILSGTGQIDSKRSEVSGKSSGGPVTTSGSKPAEQPIAAMTMKIKCNKENKGKNRKPENRAIEKKNQN